MILEKEDKSKTSIATCPDATKTKSHYLSLSREKHRRTVEICHPLTWQPTLVMEKSLSVRLEEESTNSVWSELIV